MNASGLTYYKLYLYFLKEYNKKDDPNKNKDFFSLLFHFSKHVRNIASFYIFKNKDIDFNEHIEEFINSLYLIFKTHYPVSYLINHHYFYGLKYFIKEGALIPRSETELLVDKIILENDKKNLKVLDLCAGIGNIGLTIANNLKAQVTLVEKYLRPYSLLRINARRLHLLNQVKIKKMDIKEFLITNKKKFDLLIMNPPYIAYNDKKVENNVKTHEPKLALYAKNNGLYYYQLVLNYLPYLMNKTITCYFEINQDHTHFLTKIINNL
ncbi:HemK family protein methyltransferase [bacterium]|nr:HemK family protein methyltransferase [bacterium]